MSKHSPDPRFKQANKEALLSLGAYALYFIWWYACAYGMGSGSPDDYGYVFGMPEWFFYSCIVGYPLITLLLWGIVRFKFKHMPLEAEPPSNSTATGEGR